MLRAALFALEEFALHFLIWILGGVLGGAVCGCGAIHWAHRLLKTRNRPERTFPFAKVLLILAAAAVGGVIGYYTQQVLPLLSCLAVMTVAITVLITDWLCRLIPNPTVLAVLAIKLVLIVAALLHIPGAPAIGLLSSLGGMAFCFVAFFAPGFLGKNVGAGDVKLAAAVGFLLGFVHSLYAIIIMGILMIVYSIAQRKMPIIAFLKTNIPMGPFIAAGMLVVWVLSTITL